MAKTKTRRATVVVTLMVLGFLVFLFQYLLNYDYKVEPIGQDSTAQLGALEPELKLEEDARRQIVLRFTLRNATQSRLKIADSMVLSPLYEVKMHVKKDDGSFELCSPTPQNLAMKRKESTEKASLGRDSIALVELLPASGYSRAIVLSDLFDFKREGNYSVSITYQPELLANSGPEISDLRFYQQKMTCSANFELPLKKPAPPSPPAAAERPKPKLPAATPKIEPAAVEPFSQKIDAAPVKAPQE